MFIVNLYLTTMYSCIQFQHKSSLNSYSLITRPAIFSVVQPVSGVAITLVPRGLKIDLVTGLQPLGEWDLAPSTICFWNYF